MSLLTYNGVALPYGNTIRFDMSAVYEDSQTDRILTRYEIEEQCVINQAYLNMLAPQVTPSSSTSLNNPAAILVAIRNQLLKPRQQLSFKVNGIEMIPQHPSLPGTVDARNGPQPQSCVPTQLNSNTFILNFHIVAHYWEVDDGGATLSGQSNSILTTIQGLPPNTMLSNRWSESVEWDDCMMSKRTREGKYIIRSDNAQGLIADKIRESVAVVGIPAGFLRDSSLYRVDPTGLAIEYRLVDREVFKKPPKPAFTAKGKYHETCTQGDAKRVGNVWVELKGAKTTPQADLINAAISVCAAKLGANGATGRLFGGQGKATGFTSELQVDMYENIVFFRMGALLSASPARLENIAGFTGTAQTFTPLTDGTGPGAGSYNPPYLSRGSAGYLLQAAAYYDPSLANVLLKNQTFVPAPQSQVGVNAPGSQLGPDLLAPGTAGKFRENQPPDQGGN